MPVAKKRWKRQELRISRRLNLRRIAAHGRAAADLEGEWLVVEVTDRKRIPRWLEHGVERAKHRALPNRLGLVVITGADALHDYVVLDLQDWISWFGRDRPKEES